MLDEQARLNNYVLEAAYISLTKLNDYGRHLTLIGAYSIFRQLKAQYVGFDENSRVTKDLDFELYNLSLNETDYILFQRDLTSVLGSEYSINFFPLKQRPRSITYTFQVEYKGIRTSRLKIDFSLVKGEKSFDCQPLYVSLATKLCLSAKLVDRRMKDKVDLFTVLHYLYPKGVKKGELLKIIANTKNKLEVDPRWFTDEGVLLAKRSGRGFNGYSSSDLFNLIGWVRTLLLGLTKNKLSNDAVFYGGNWL
jgi:hypothetical protein